jgi:tetratricopeptide (TPR) repeat protein
MSGRASRTGEPRMNRQLHRLEKAFRRHPRSPLFARLAEQYLRRGRLQRAQALCEEGCRRFPDYPTGHFLLGRCFEHQRMWEEARAAADRGLRLDPDNPGGYRQLARAYRELGNDTLALKCLERAASLDPLSESLNADLDRLSASVRHARPVAVATVAHDDESAVTPVATEPRATREPVEPNAGVPAEPRESQDPPLAESMASGGPEAAGRGSAGDGAEDEGLFDPLPEATEADGAEDETDGPDAEIGAPEIDRVPGGGPLAAADEAPDEAGHGTAQEEPFGQVLDLPEWDEAAETGDEAPAPAASRDEEADVEPHVAPEPVAPEPGRSQEDPADEDEGFGNEMVADLGAGLFDDEEDPDAAPVESSEDSPRARSGTRRNAVAPTPRVDAVTEAAIPSVEDVASQQEVAAQQEAAESAPAAARKVPANDDAPTPPAEARDVPEPYVAPRSGRLAGEIDDLGDLLGNGDVDGPEGADGDESDDAWSDGDGVATVTLAELYARQGYTEKAREIYERVLRADPDNESARRGAAELSAP